jgi:hypothetical protein
LSICVGFPLSLRRSALAVAWVGVFALAAPLAACAGNETAGGDATGQLFARGLDDPGAVTRHDWFPLAL